MNTFVIWPKTIDFIVDKIIVNKYIFATKFIFENLIASEQTSSNNLKKLYNEFKDIYLNDDSNLTAYLIENKNCPQEIVDKINANNIKIYLNENDQGYELNTVLKHIDKSSSEFLLWFAEMFIQNYNKFPKNLVVSIINAPNFPPKYQKMFLSCPQNIRDILATCKSLSKEMIEKLSKDPSLTVQMNIVRRKDIDTMILADMARNSQFKEVKQRAKQILTYVKYNFFQTKNDLPNMTDKELIELYEEMKLPPKRFPLQDELEIIENELKERGYLNDK